MQRRALGRRQLVLGVAALWAALSLARLTRLIEPPEPPPGREVEQMLRWLMVTIPRDAGYLYVLPGAFGAGGETGAAPRLRYELFPRPYEDVRASEDEAAVRRLMRQRDLRYVVVPDARRYAESSWLRQPRDWLRRVDFNAEQYVLQVVA